MVSNWIQTIIISLMIFCSAHQARAAQRNILSIQKLPPVDLVRETSQLSLTEEKSIQGVNPPQNLFFSVLAGTLQPTSLTVDTPTRSVRYEFTRTLPVVTAQFSHFPISSRRDLGYLLSLGYSYSEYGGYSKTALHLVPVQALAVYRYDKKSSQKLIPFGVAGATNWVYFQRGVEQYNTSGSYLGGALGAGVSLNLNRLGWTSSRNDSEVILQYQRLVSTDAASANFNGNLLEIGGSLAF